MYSKIVFILLFATSAAGSHLFGRKPANKVIKNKTSIFQQSEFDVSEAFEGGPGCLEMESREEVVDCINSTIVNLADKLDDVPTCVNTTMTTLALCSIDNWKTCAETCEGALSFKNFFETVDLEPVDLATCKLIQENVMLPLCANDCCPPCQQALEEVVECFVNDVLDYTILDCDLECSNVDGERKLVAGKLFLLRGSSNNK